MQSNLTNEVLPHPCSSDSKMSTWVEESSPVAVQPPSVKAEGIMSSPVPKKSSITSTYMEFSPHWAATLLAGTGWYNSKGISGCCGSSGRLGKRHVSFATGLRISSFDWTLKISWEGLPKSPPIGVWMGKRCCAKTGLLGSTWGILVSVSWGAWPSGLGLGTAGFWLYFNFPCHCASDKQSVIINTNPKQTFLNPIVRNLQMPNANHWLFPLCIVLR